MPGKKKTRARHSAAHADRFVAQVYDTEGHVQLEAQEFATFYEARRYIAHSLEQFKDHYPPARRAISRAIRNARESRRPFVVNALTFRFSVFRVPARNNPGARKKAPRKKAAPRKKRATKKKTARRARNPIPHDRLGYIVFVDGPSGYGYLSEYVPPQNGVLVMTEKSAHPFTKGQAERIAADLSKVKGVTARAQRAEKKKPLSRRKNPDADLEAARAAFEQFTGHDAERVEEVVLWDSEAAWGLGPVAAIEYIARRDGETAIYRHEFKKRARPLLASSIDGQQLYLLGGAYSVTDRGIVDDA